MHPRSLIRAAAVAALSGATDAGPRVYPSRTRPLNARLLPAIGVYVTDESADDGQTRPRTYVRTATLAVDVIAQEDDSLDDTLDTICLQVEEALLVDPLLGGVCDDLVYRGTNVTLVPARDSDPGKGAAMLTFDVEYRTEQPEPTLDDFRTAVVGWDLAPDPYGDVDAEDKITLPIEEVEA